MGNDLHALALLASGSAGSSFNWSTPQGSVSSAAINVPSASLANAGIYICVGDANGCASDSAFVTVSVDSCIVIVHPDPVVPNVFTPNGDGVNDVITLISPSQSPLAFNIFNRWGKLVFTTEGVSITWNGRTSGNDLLSDGVYYYELLGTRVDGSAIMLKGYIQVMREK